MSDVERHEITQLTLLVQEFRQRLAERGITLEIAPGASLSAQFSQLVQATLADVDRCRMQLPATREAEFALRDSATRLWRFIENAPVAIAMFDRNMRYLAVSRRWLTDYHLQGQTIIGQSHYTIFPEIPDAWKRVHQRALAGEVVEATNDRFVRADGTIQWLRWEVRPWYQDGNTVGGIIIFSEDITDLKSAEEQLQRQNRALRLLSTANEALVRTTTEEVLLQRVCDIAVEVGGYRFAWVGYVNQDETKSVQPVAHAGVDGDYLANHIFSWDETRPEGKGPLGQAIRLRHPVFADNIETAPLFEPWREDALAHGYRAAIVLPLIANQEVIGVCALYRAEPYQFTTDECTLLMELANDLAFGITTLRVWKARRKAEEGLRKSEARYRTIVETAQEGIWILDKNLNVIYANARLGAMLGCAVSDILGRSLFDFILPELHDEMVRHKEKRREGMTEVYEFQFRRQDGSILWALISAAPLRDDQGQFIGTIGMLTDVTERHHAEAYQREFARKTIEAATEGKLIISERSAVFQMAGPPIASWDIRQVEDLEVIRHAVADITRAAGMDDDRVSDFLLCISEAATNAYKHAGQGLCSLHRRDSAFFVVIADQGPGILAMHLPELALTPGYTTGVSLGMGYKAMIALADKVYLATGPDGTVVGIQMAMQQPPVPPPFFPGVTGNW